MRLFAKFFLITILGWKIDGFFPKHLKKYVIIAAPHTHWQDFPLGILVKWIQQTPINYIGKASLFKPPFGFIFRWLGGTPVNRSESTNKVEAIVNVFNVNENFILALSPEGTRKRIDEWKTGFYYIALKANVPIVPVAFDYGKKEVKVGNPFPVTGNYDEDMKLILPFYKGVKGKNPERGFEV